MSTRWEKKCSAYDYGLRTGYPAVSEQVKGDIMKFDKIREEMAKKPATRRRGVDPLKRIEELEKPWGVPMVWDISVSFRKR